MTLPDKHSTLRDVLKVFAESGEKPWTLLLSEVQAKLNARADTADLAKAKKAEIRIELDALGARCSEAIAGLRPERCNQLTEDEVCAYCRRGLKLMRPQLADFRDARKGPPLKGHAPIAGERGAFIYHFKPIEAWWRQHAEEANENHQVGANVRWNSDESLHKRLRALELKEEDRAREKRAIQAALEARVTAFAGVEPETLLEVRQFLLHQAASLHAAVAVEQPWIVDASGKITDSAWLPFDRCDEITGLLTDGGSIQNFSLTSALELDWTDGEAWQAWRYVLSVAVENARVDFNVHGAEMQVARALEGIEFDPDRPPRDRARS
ncbi:hypothetical protein HDE76_000019 [Rhodanobacter sp. ANJX3]|uniref:hypothetical protein n=1 Tax=Rhodanobacter sp. ANJX3 TaxID=2723083 RepID=UPI00160D3367|nr:hypothetical protein [Rhodanobacter sp. ANJX3]MBB5356837.1 hypothetical protein [Rhodanobacter sp. ANJX3]